MQRLLKIKLGSSVDACIHPMVVTYLLLLLQSRLFFKEVHDGTCCFVCNNSEEGYLFTYFKGFI